MFINISNQLPKTSYIKMMDVWLIFNLILPFTEVLLHTYKVMMTFLPSIKYSSQDYLRDEQREVNHHGRVRKLDADGKEITGDEEDDAPNTLKNNWVTDLDLISRHEDVQVDFG